MMARFGPLKELELQRFVLGDDCWVLGCPPAKARPVPAGVTDQTTHAVDRRRVANPIQARTLLHAVGQQRGGRRLVAFFGCLYYAALRPEEAISLAKQDLSLPTRGWGELHVERAEPYAGKEWTDSGRNRDQRPLKQRARGEVRLVPCPPPLTTLLHATSRSSASSPTGDCSSASATTASCPR